MSEEVSSLPAHRSPLRTAVGLLLLIALIASGAAWIHASGGIARFTRTPGEAKARAVEYMLACARGDVDAAVAMAHEKQTRKFCQDDCEIFKRWGPVKEFSLNRANWVEVGDRQGWFMDGVAHFATGGSTCIARVFKVNGEWKVFSVGLSNSRDPKGVDDESGFTSPEPTTQPSTTQPAVVQKRYAAPPVMALDLSRNYSATIQTTRGEIRLDLFPKEAPNTVNSFVFLAQETFFDGLSFHRVEPGFVIQGGDPLGTGEGGPGYMFNDETDPVLNPHTFTPGTLAMANAGPNTNGSQFFIMQSGSTEACKRLQGKYSVFGQVHDAESQKVVDSIQKGDRMITLNIHVEK